MSGVCMKNHKAERAGDDLETFKRAIADSESTHFVTFLPFSYSYEGPFVPEMACARMSQQLEYPTDVQKLYLCLYEAFTDIFHTAPKKDTHL